MDKAYIRFLVHSRPGAFSANAKLMLDVLRSAAGNTDCVRFPASAIEGGDCGSYSKRTDFVRSLTVAKAEFANAYAAIPKCPQVKFEGNFFQIISKSGTDAKLPFCGQPQKVLQLQSLQLARRLAAIGCKKAVVGLSGGLDSTLALIVACEAFRLLELDVKGLIAYTMPGFGTTSRTRSNAEKLAEGLGVELRTVDITDSCRLHFRDIGHDEYVHDVVYENAQARERTQILMDVANQEGAIVLGTGDMSEIALGWSTYNGDHMSMYGVNAGVPKTAIRDVCRFWTEANPGIAAEAVLDILDTPVSPELLPAKDGQIVQKTEDRIGPYELHDFFLWHYAGEGKERDAVQALAANVFEGVYDCAVISKWLDVFVSRLASQAFKRNCAPDGARVFKLFFSPFCWHGPSDFKGV